MARILIAPLNWGLGHATRCIPIGAAFAKTNDIEVHWASDGQALDLLRHELPNASIHELPAFTVRYPSTSAYNNMLRIGPGMMRSISADRKAIDKLHKKFAYDLIISDNRFGCRVKGVRSCILTHQVHLPLKHRLAKWMGNAMNHSFLRGFDEVLIPDYPGNKSLAGAMSAPLKNQPCSYLGPVSRFLDQEFQQPDSAPDLAIILSGPEPQRSIVEREILKEVCSTPGLGSVLFVRGLPNAKSSDEITVEKLILAEGTQLEIENFLGSAELGPVLAKAKRLLVRPGYTTVMDLAAIGRKAIYVPTPGQPEQEWLGENLHHRKRGVCIKQGELVLAKALSALNLLEEPEKERTNHLLDKWVDTAVSRFL